MSRGADSSNAAGNARPGNPPKHSDKPAAPAGSATTRARSPRQEGPRRVRHGIKLRSEGDPQYEHWAAKRWMNCIQANFSAETLAAGLEYAKLGQIRSLELTRGGVEASIQGRAPGPYAVSIRAATFSDRDWDRLVKTLAADSMSTARLLTGEMPDDLERLLGDLELNALEAAEGALRVQCACRYGRPCKHAAAAAYLVAERLESTPLDLFIILGLEHTTLIDRLRPVRAIHTRGQAAAHAEPVLSMDLTQPAPLEACMDEFWRCGPELQEFEHAPPPHHANHALLRRLGPSPLPGRFPIVGMLASIYDVVRARALKIREEAERIGETPADESASDSSSM